MWVQNSVILHIKAKYRLAHSFVCVCLFVHLFVYIFLTLYLNTEKYNVHKYESISQSQHLISNIGLLLFVNPHILKAMEKKTPYG